MPEALGGLTPIGSGVNSNDVFMIKLDSSGSPVWAKSFGSTSTGLDKGYGIAVDASGGSYTTGSFANSMTVGSTTLTSVGLYDVFMIKLNSSL